MKVNLYINLGNTHTTFAYNKNKNTTNLKIIKTKSNKFKKNGQKLLKNILLKINKKININKIYICSTTNQISKIFEAYLLKKEYKYYFLKYKDINFVNFSNFETPSTIGSDILAQICYINKKFKECIVLSLGTAITIYHFRKPKITGINILPGIGKSIKNLTSNTDIKNIKIIESKNILGLNTNEAISIGLINNIIFFIDNIQKQLNTKCPVVYTGGDAKYFDNDNWEFIDNLEILGLMALFENNI